jgi:hypothetical protein
MEYQDAANRQQACKLPASETVTTDLDQVSQGHNMYWELRILPAIGCDSLPHPGWPQG